MVGTAFSRLVACFSFAGMSAVDRDKFIILVTGSASSSRHHLSKDVGIGSSMLVLGFALLIIFDILSTSRGLKASNELLKKTLSKHDSPCHLQSQTRT